MIYTAIWVVVWLVNGTPITLSGKVPGMDCIQEHAARLVAESNLDIQPGFSWWCDLIAAKPPYVPEQPAEKRDL